MVNGFVCEVSLMGRTGGSELERLAWRFWVWSVRERESVSEDGDIDVVNKEGVVRVGLILLQFGEMRSETRRHVTELGK